MIAPGGRAALWAYRVASLGPVAGSGVALAILAAAGHALVTLPAAERAARLAHERAQIAAKRTAAPQAAASEAARQRTQRQAWPARGQAVDLVAGVHQSAQEKGVQLAQGEYRLAAPGTDLMPLLQITLPARSSYPAWRNWLTEVMNQWPAAALEEISIRRDEAASESVETRVRWTIAVREE